MPRRAICSKIPASKIRSGFCGRNFIISLAYRQPRKCDFKSRRLKSGLVFLSAVQQSIARSFKCLLHKPHIPMECVFPCRYPKAVFPQPEFDSGNKLRPREITFIPERPQQCDASRRDDSPLDRIVKHGIYISFHWSLDIFG